MTPEFKIVAHESKAWETAVKLREEILRKPLGSYFTPEELEEEQHHVQVVGLMNDEIIATAVLVPEGEKIKMQRVVVSEAIRNLSIGSKMMLYCEAFARDEGYQVVYCHARDSAVNFYLNNGYAPDGDYFDEDGIPHLKMGKAL